MHTLALRACHGFVQSLFWRDCRHIRTWEKMEHVRAWKNEKRTRRFGRPCLVKFNLPHIDMSKCCMKHQISRGLSVELSIKSLSDMQCIRRTWLLAKSHVRSKEDKKLFLLRGLSSTSVLQEIFIQIGPGFVAPALFLIRVYAPA